MKKNIFIVCLVFIMLLTACTADKMSKDGKTEKQFSVSSYVGDWIEPTITWERGGVILELDIEGDKLNISCTRHEGEPNCRIALIRGDVVLSDIEDSVVVLPYNNDSCGNSGVLNIIFNDNAVLCRVTNVVMDPNSMYGFFAGDYELERYDGDANEMYMNLGIEYDKKYGNDSELNNQKPISFRDSCIYLDYSPVGRDNPRAFQAGRDYYAANPVELDTKDVEKCIKQWEDYVANGTDSVSYRNAYESERTHLRESNSLEEYLDNEIYGPMGSSILNKQAKAILEGMCYYPNQYVNNAYVLKDIRFSEIWGTSYHTGDMGNNAPYKNKIVINDGRADVKNPTVLGDGNCYDIYCVFTGNGATREGHPILYFTAIEVEKIIR